MSASEANIEAVRERNRMLERIAEVQGYLDNTERKNFTSWDIYKVLEHIKKGCGWI